MASHINTVNSALITSYKICTSCFA
uniref:Uncharacterized protein n=1 Tax=Anguilla anguilla TaxID=7936 RepID=A0A0E9SQH0_ANGAN